MSRLKLLLEQFQSLDSRTRLQAGIAVAALLVLAILYSAATEQVARLQKKRAARESDVAEMMVLKQRHQEASVGARMMANRMAALRPDDSPAKIVEETGIKGKSSQSRQLRTEEKGGFLEESAEVKIEGLTANEAVNLLFRLENGNKPVQVKKAQLKTRYDDPSRLDATLTIALLRPVAQGQK
jgi:general secretion pathway protein M